MSTFMTFLIIRLGMAPSMSQYLSFISNIVAEFVDNEDSQAGLQGIYGISLETLLHQKEVHRLSGYRGESPVVVGNNVPSNPHMFEPERLVSHKLSRHTPNNRNSKNPPSLPTAASSSPWRSASSTRGSTLPATIPRMNSLMPSQSQRSVLLPYRHRLNLT